MYVMLQLFLSFCLVVPCHHTQLNGLVPMLNVTIKEVVQLFAHYLGVHSLMLSAKFYDCRGLYPCLTFIGGHIFINRSVLGG